MALIGLLADNKEPFFLYLPFNHVHEPQFAGKKFTGSTSRGMFGDSLVCMYGQLY